MIATMEPVWVERERCKTWEDADRTREAIVNGERLRARIRYEQPEHVVEVESDFCQSCGASVPARDGEGTCSKCQPRKIKEGHGK